MIYKIKLDLFFNKWNMILTWAYEPNEPKIEYKKIEKIEYKKIDKIGPFEVLSDWDIKKIIYPFKEREFDIATNIVSYKIIKETDKEFYVKITKTEHSHTLWKEEQTYLYSLPKLVAINNKTIKHTLNSHNQAEIHQNEERIEFAAYTTDWKLKIESVYYNWKNYIASVKTPFKNLLPEDKKIIKKYFWINVTQELSALFSKLNKNNDPFRQNHKRTYQK